MKKLSAAQQKVVDILKENPSYYIRTSPYYNYQEIESPEFIKGKYDNLTHHVEYFTKPTLKVLVDSNIIVPINSMGHMQLNKINLP